MTYFVAVVFMCFGPLAADCRYAVRPVITISKQECKEELDKQIRTAAENNVFAVGSCAPVILEGKST